MNTNPFATYTSPNGLAYRVTGIEKVESSERWNKWSIEISLDNLYLFYRIR